MDNWQQDFLAILETVTVETENFCQDFNEVMETIAQEFQENFTMILEEVQEMIASEIEYHLETLFNSLLETETEVESITISTVTETRELSINPKLEPTLNKHPACVGCCYYHGQVYNGNLLVCGMHPFGSETESCPDWEAENN